MKVDGVNKALLVVTEALPPDSSRPDVAVALFHAIANISTTASSMPNRYSLTILAAFSFSSAPGGNALFHD